MIDFSRVDFGEGFVDLLEGVLLVMMEMRNKFGESLYVGGDIRW